MLNACSQRHLYSSATVRRSRDKRCATRAQLFASSHAAMGCLALVPRSRARVCALLVERIAPMHWCAARRAASSLCAPLRPGPGPQGARCTPAGVLGKILGAFLLGRPPPYARAKCDSQRAVRVCVQRQSSQHSVQLQADLTWHVRGATTLSALGPGGVPAWPELRPHALRGR